MVTNELLLNIIDKTVELSESGLSSHEILDELSQVHDDEQTLIEQLIDSSLEHLSERMRGDIRDEIYSEAYSEIYEKESDKIRNEIKNKIEVELKKEKNEYLRELFNLEVVEKKYPSVFNQINSLVIKKLLSNEIFRSKILGGLRNRIIESIETKTNDPELGNIPIEIENSVINHLLNDINYINKIESKVIEKLADDMFKL